MPRIPPLTRRNLLLGGCGAFGCLLCWGRFGGYEPIVDWRGQVLSEREARIVAAAAEALLPSDTAGIPRPLQVAANVDRYLVSVGAAQQDAVHAALLTTEHCTLLDGQLERLTRLAVGEREAYLATLADAGEPTAMLYTGLRDLCMMGAYQAPSTWPSLGYDGPYVGRGREDDPSRVLRQRYEALRAAPGEVRPGAVTDAMSLALPATIRAELCVIGSGAGGAMAAMTAAEAGVDVVLLEAGELLGPAEMSQREEQMIPRLFWEAGARMTGDGLVRVHQGKGVGGSTLHNLNLCKRIPDAILGRWERERRLTKLTPETWAALYGEVEALLAVSVVPEARWNRHNTLLRDACDRLGWAGAGLAHNRTDCIGSGFCQLGCAYDAKNNAAKLMVPRALKAGARILARCHAVRIDHARGRARGVEAVARDPVDGRVIGRVRVEAERVCVAASATSSPALLLASGVPDPSGTTGSSLHIHPAVSVAAEMGEPVRAWEGIPQSYECTEWLDLGGGRAREGHRLWIVPTFGHPMTTAAMLPGHGAFHRGVMKRYSHLAGLSAMLHDETRGSVRPRGELGLTIDYEPIEADRRELALGIWASAKLLFAAGARRVILPGRQPTEIARGESLAGLREAMPDVASLGLNAVHPMASIPMGDDPATAAVGSDGKHHHLDGLWIADGSLFPSSIGVPPQVSIYALGLHVGRALSRG
jgi:choline dehydrogenase-like flavoprotein